MNKIIGIVNQLKKAQQVVDTRIEKLEVDLEKFIDFPFHLVNSDKGFMVSDNYNNITSIDVVSSYLEAEKTYTYKRHLDNVQD